MNFCKKAAAAILLASISAPLAAQQDVQVQDQQEREAAVKEAEIRMHEAEIELEVAARRIAELSAAQLARAGELQREFIIRNNRPVIGITIGSASDSGPVEGVTIDGISPGGAAEEAGLLAGDIITAINDESMSSENAMVANRKLFDFMSGVEEGDDLEIEYLRNNKPGKAELVPLASSAEAFSFNFDGYDFSTPVAPNAPNAPVAPQVYAYRWMGNARGHGFGDMEMIELNESLGRYFGADSGLLVVRAPADNVFKLQDGDVIVSIDGRAPKDLHHAVRILSSYESGETVNLDIMRDKRKQTLTIEIPDNRHSIVVPVPDAAPAAIMAPSPAAAPSIYMVPPAPAPGPDPVVIIRTFEEKT